MAPTAAAAEPAALLLVDRSLDLLTPLGHGAHLLDCVYGCLPRRNSPGTLKCSSHRNALLCAMEQRHVAVRRSPVGDS